MTGSSLMKFTVKVRSEPGWRRISRNQRPSCNQALLHQCRIQFSVCHRDGIKLSPIPILILRNILSLRDMNWLSIDRMSNSRYLWLISVLRPTARSSSLSRDSIGFYLFLLLKVPKVFLCTIRRFSSFRHFTILDSFF